MGLLRNTHLHIVSGFRGLRGVLANKTAAKQPKELLVLYEFEICPYCRKVREALTELDIAYICRPCAKGSNNRAYVKSTGGRSMYPYLVDANTGRAMYESEDIIDYLLETYGGGKRRFGKLFAPVNTVTSFLASAVQGRGRYCTNDGAKRKQPDQLLELYGFEASPYCRKVREVLNELNLDHIIHSAAKGSARRETLLKIGGKVMVPYLIDPNTGTQLYESDDIVDYLQRQYG